MNGEHILYLTSNGCLDIYESNTPANFINRLSTPLMLENNVDYEVGLVGILYPDKYYGLLANDDDYKIIVSTNYEKTGSSIISVRLQQNILAGDLHKMVKIVNKNLMNHLKTYYSADIYKKMFKRPMILKWNEEESRVEIHRALLGTNELFKTDIRSITITLMPGLARVFGFISERQYTIFSQANGLSVHKSSFLPSPRCDVDYIYLYSDIIQPSHFAGQLVNILDCFTLQNGGNKGVHNTIYKPLNTRFIDQISIKVRDQHARPINFIENSTITCVLNIRPK